METKKRSTNFSTKEELLLISLAGKYRHKVECKRTDTMTNKAKAAAWSEVADEYNSTSGEIYRDVKTLKSKYENLKKTSKRKFAEEKRYATGTGGGPPKDSKVTIIDEQIKELLGDQLSGFPSEFEDDSENVVNGIEPVPLPELSTEFVILEPEMTVRLSDEVNKPENAGVALQGSSKNTTIPVVVESNDWSDYTPSMLRTPKAVPLRQIGTNSHGKENFVNRRGQSKDKLSAWVSTKVQLTEMQKLCLQQESEKKMELMERESQKRIEIMEQEANEKRDKKRKKLEYMEKEHLLRMKILASQLKT